MRGPEARLQRKIKKAIEAAFPGSFVTKIHGNQFQNIGIPDLICCIYGFFFGIEVKVPGRKGPTEAQREIILRIRSAWGTAGVGRNPQAVVEAIRRSLERRLLEMARLFGGKPLGIVGLRRAYLTRPAQKTD